MASSIISSIKSAGKNLDSLDELLLEELKELYDVEERIIEALPAMAEAVSTPQLKKAFKEHLEQTKRQKRRLEQAFKALDVEPEASTCPAMKGMIEEGEVIIKAKGDPKVKDAALIAAAQRVEHYEIAVYGAARTFAAQLGNTKVRNLLQQTLDEEGRTDEKLTEIADSTVNVQAARR